MYQGVGYSQKNILQLSLNNIFHIELDDKYVFMINGYVTLNVYILLSIE